MLVVESVPVRRHWFEPTGAAPRSIARMFLQGKAIRQICRELKLSRKVGRKVLRLDESS